MEVNIKKFNKETAKVAVIIPCDISYSSPHKGGLFYLISVVTTIPKRLIISNRKQNGEKNDKLDFPNNPVEFVGSVTGRSDFLINGKIIIEKLTGWNRVDTPKEYRAMTSASDVYTHSPLWGNAEEQT
jgi:hypothetical protein